MRGDFRFSTRPFNALISWVPGGYVLFRFGFGNGASQERKKEARSPGFMKKTFPSFSLTKGLLKRLSFFLCFSLF